MLESTAIQQLGREFGKGKEIHTRGRGAREKGTGGWGLFREG